MKVLLTSGAMKCVGLLETSSVRPSGSAVIAALTPIVVPPPGRLSTTTDCPRRMPSGVAIRRATTSLGEPGVNGAMMLIVRSGVGWARAGSADANTPRHASQTAVIRSWVFRSVIVGHFDGSAICFATISATGRQVRCCSWLKAVTSSGVISRR